MNKRKKQIIQAAMDIISREGIQNCTTRRLASKVGVTEPSLYRHFNNKMHIISEVFITILGQAEDRLKNIIVRQDITPGNKLELIFIETCKYFYENPPATAILFYRDIFKHKNELSRTVYSIMIKRQNIIRPIIEEGQKSGEIVQDVPPHDITLIFLGLLRMLINRWVLLEYNFDVVKRGTELSNSFLILIRQKN